MEKKKDEGRNEKKKERYEYVATKERIKKDESVGKQRRKRK